VSSVIDVAATTTDRPPVLDDRSLMGHPRGLGLLFVVEMWERFSYYGMRALLVLYLVNGLQWTDGAAASLYGTYTGLVYLTPLIGGYLADRFIGTRRSLVIGSIIIAAGHFSLAVESMTMFYLGLALIIIGTGFFKPNVSTMVGQMYREGDNRRDSGFTIFYMGINLGAFLAPLVCGYLGQNIGWHYGFGAAGVGMVLGLLTYLWGRDKYLPGIGLTPKENRNNAAAVAARAVTEEGSISPVPAAIGAVVGVLIAFLFKGGWFGMATAAVIGAALATTFVGTKGEERKRVTAIFILVFFVIFFWMAFEQAGSSMNLFADRYTDLSLGGITFPSSWFQAINPLFILIFAPVFASLWTTLDRKKKEPSTAMKMVLGLVLLGVGFLFMVAAGRAVDADSAVRVSPLWLTMAYAFHTWGELCLSPVGLSYVTKVAPVRFASLLMGVWFLANAAANKLGGFLAGQTENIESQATFFSIPVATSIGSAILLLMLVPVLKNLTKSVKA
jgi:proton-dependent oligopeptide transporter, POT family